MRKIMIGAALLALVIMVGWYEGLYRSETAHISALQTSEQAAQASVTALQAQYTGLVVSEKQIPKERKALAALNQLLPAGPDLDSLEKIFAQAATKAGVTLDNVASPAPSDFASAVPAPTTGLPGPSQLSLTLGVTGTPHALVKLYQVLDSEPRLFVIDNCVLTLNAVSSKLPATANAPVGATLDIRAFFTLANPTSAAS